MLEGILLPDIQALSLAAFGGILMGYAMFRLLPGMKEDAYTPREWLPIAAYLSLIGWFTYFIPQFVYDWLDRGRDFHVQSTFVAVLFAAYVFTLIVTLWFLQRRRNRKG